MQIYDAIAKKPVLFVKQKKELGEIIFGFEIKNKYEIFDEAKGLLGSVVEQGGGIWHIIKRLFLRSHRGFTIDVLDVSNQIAFELRRSFFFFFSDLFIVGKDGQLIGAVHRRFGIINKKYDLKDNQGQIFARIASPIWRLWTFPVIEVSSGQKHAEIAKRWGGALREVFTDADTFMVNFGSAPWNARQRTVIFAAAISIDFDFFENNQGRQGILDI